MFVQRIQEFIKDQRDAGQSTSTDEILLDAIHERFSSRAESSQLDEFDHQFLRQIFCSRWYGSNDTSKDYTHLSDEADDLKSNEIKKLWNGLAANLSGVTGIARLDILLPAMTIQSILDFINGLMRETKVGSNDSKLTLNLSDRFSGKFPKSKPTHDDIDFIIESYKLRWNFIRGTDEDYTLNPNSINTKWALFAKKLSHYTGISYLKILMHNLNNKLDPNDDSQLTDTTNVWNTFYINLEGNVFELYRKKSFCELLIKQKFVLSLWSTSGNQKENRSVSVDVLHRLKSGDSATGAFKIGEVPFSSFGDFLSREIFSRLASRGKYPKGDLLPLLKLVERYYLLKSNGAHFDEFKNDAQVFFKQLAKNNLNNVEQINYLYGQKIHYGGENHYLIDLFIAILDSNSFNLDNGMNALLKLLFSIHPYLKSINNDLAFVYHDPIVAFLKPREAYNRCCALLVSLYVTNFNMGSFTRTIAITDLDKRNIIPEELHALYSVLQTVTSAQNDMTYAVANYEGIIRNIIEPLQSSDPWFRSKKTKIWLNRVLNSELTDVGGIAVDLELILSVLQRFHFSDVQIEAKKYLFLDDLIKTSAQAEKNADCVVKQRRVSILFSRFLTYLEPSRRRDLLLEIAFGDLSHAKEEFLNNCVLYIDDRLKQLGYEKKIAVSPNFFPSFAKPITVKDKPLPTVSELLQLYSVHLPVDHLSQEVSTKVDEFLFESNRTIMTSIKSDAVQTSYFGMSY